MAFKHKFILVQNILKSLHFFFLNICKVFGKAEWHREKKRDFSIHWLTPQMPTPFSLNESALWGTSYVSFLVSQSRPKNDFCCCLWDEPTPCAACEIWTVISVDGSCCWQSLDSHRVRSDLRHVLHRSPPWALPAKTCWTAVFSLVMNSRVVDLKHCFFPSLGVQCENQ